MKYFFTSNGRNSANKFLEGLNKWLFCKKGVNLSCSNEHDWKEQIKKKARQQWRQNTNSFTKSDEQMKKVVFVKNEETNKGDFFFKNKQKKHKRERKHKHKKESR